VILGDYNLSNHCPIAFIYTFREIKHRKRGFFLMNNKYVDNLNVIFDMTKLWERSKDTTPFSSKLWKVVKFHKLFFIRKAKENKMVEK
jgi:hypothetical protein